MKTIKPLGLTAGILSASLLILSTGCNAKPEAAASPAASTPATAPGQPVAAKAKDPVTVTPDANAPHHAWTEDQILTCTVSQCWQLSGKNEDSFFDIVQQLSVLSAKDRNLTLPETEAAGQRPGSTSRPRPAKITINSSTP